MKTRERAAREVDELELRARVGEIVNRRPVVGLAVGVVRGGGLERFSAHGFADIASGTPITEDTVFRVASITKTLTAVAVMQLSERGLVDLDAPANNYLRAYRLVPAEESFRPATVRDLLTHTAGVPQMPRPGRALAKILAGSMLTEGGESYDLGGPVPTLAEFYGGALRLVAEPGTRFTYGNHGFATLGQIVEDVSGAPLDRYVRERIFEPLGMTDSDLVRSDRVEPHLATGYTLRSDGPSAVTDRQRVGTGASAAYSTPRDMGRYVAALLGGGANDHGRILQPATMATMFEPHYQTDPRVPGMGLGFFRSDLGGHLAVEHPGILPGFNSQIFAAPDDGVGVIAFTNGASGALMWMPAEVGRLLGHLLGVPEDGIRTDVPHRPEIWGDICGWYPVSAQLTDMQARAIAGLGAEVFVRGGRLMVRALSPVPALYRGFPLHPDDEKDPYVFRVDLSRYGIGTAKVVFSRDAGGETRVHLDFVPLSLQRRPAAESPRSRIKRGLTGLAVAAAAVAAVRRARARPRQPRLI